MEYSSAPRQRRRLVILIVILFVAVISFFAGRHFGSAPQTYVQSGGAPANPAVTDHKGGIPPDSLGGGTH